MTCVTVWIRPSAHRLRQTVQARKHPNDFRHCKHGSHCEWVRNDAIVTAKVALRSHREPDNCSAVQLVSTFGRSLTYSAMLLRGGWTSNGDDSCHTRYLPASHAGHSKFRAAFQVSCVACACFFGWPRLTCRVSKLSVSKNADDQECQSIPLHLTYRQLLPQTELFPACLWLGVGSSQ